LKVPAKIHELDVLPDGAAMQAALLELTGQRTVPNVFINGKHLGGNDKVMMNGTNVFYNRF
jgi:glutaredoxin 3